MNFTRAAEELHVTQAAVSHQIRQLEERLEIPLFRRFGRRLALTEQGRALLPTLSEAFDRIAETIEGLSAGRTESVLSVTIRPYFGMKWLAPRLGRFWQACPQVALRLHHSIEPVDFARQDADLAIVWGRGDWPDVGAELLMRGPLTPVCSPALLEGAHPLRRPADLRHHNLLHAEDYDPWTLWLRGAGVLDVDPRRGTIVDDTNVRMEAAIDGQGVALGWVPLLTEDLAAGRLVQPFEFGLEDYAYYVIYPPGGLSGARVAAFRDWLFEEAAEHIATAR